MPSNSICAGSLPDQEIFLSQRRKRRSIHSLTKQAGGSAAPSVKRMGIMAALSAMMIAGSVPGIVPVASAATVTITITGTMASGTDDTGVFGFPPKTDLTKQPFSVTFTFDDTKGKSNDIPPCESEREDIESESGTSPGTAVLTIGGKQWSFGTLPLFSMTGAVQDSVVQKIIPPCNQAGNGIMNISVSETNNTPHPQGFDKVILNVIPPAGSAAWKDYNWEDAFSSAVSRMNIASAIIAGPTTFLRY